MEAEAWYKEEILAMFCSIAMLGGVLIINHPFAFALRFKIGRK